MKIAERLADEETLVHLDQPWVSFRFKVEMEDLMGGGILERNGKAKITKENLDFAAVVSGGKDLPFEISWRKKLDYYVKEHRMSEVLVLMDSMFILESWARENGNYGGKPNLRASFDNFTGECVSRYGPELVNGSMRENLGNRLYTLGVINSDSLSGYVRSLGLEDQWIVAAKDSNKIPKRMALVYEKLADIYQEIDDGNILEGMAAQVPRMLPEVYKTYRGGGFANKRPGIEVFDGVIGSLLKSGKFIFDENGMRPELKDTYKNSKIIIQLAKMVRGWANNKDKDLDKVLNREILAGVERWSMNYELHDKIDSAGTNPLDYFDSWADYVTNVGGEFGVGLILTEKTRESMKREIRKCNSVRALKHHPDRGGNEELMRRTNDLYRILSKKEEFAILSGGQ